MTCRDMLAQELQNYIGDMAAGNIGLGGQFGEEN